MKVSLSLLIAIMLIGLPFYVMYTTAMVSSDNSVMQDNTLASMEELSADGVSVNMSEDQVISILLDGYLHIDWEEIYVSSSDNIDSYVLDYDIILSPAKDWFGSEDVTVTAYYSNQENYSVVFNVNVAPVNDPPMTVDHDPYYLRITTDTQFIFTESIDLTRFFQDVDSQLSYSWASVNGLSSMSILDEFVQSVSTLGQVGNDMITITASDGEYHTNMDVYVSVELKKTLLFDEDTYIVESLDGLFDPLTHEYQVINSDHITSFAYDMECSLAPAPDWFGNENVAIHTYPIPVGINPPPINTIMSAPGNLINPPEAPNYVEYGYFEYSVSVSPVNDRPITIEDETYLMNMTSDTTFMFDTPLKMDQIFYDVDSDLSYSWVSEKGMVFPVMQGSKMYGISSYDNIGQDTITLIATDEEYAASYDFLVSMLPRNPVAMNEDLEYELNIEDFVDISTEYFMLENSDHITAEAQVKIDGTGRGMLHPDENWFGSETIALRTTPIINSINPPPLSPTIMSAPPGGSINPPAPNYVEYGYYEFDVSVAGVNDAPTMVAAPSVTMNEDDSAANALYVDDYFQDIDSSLSFSVEGTSNIRAELLPDNAVSINPEDNWFGTEIVTVSATDGEYTLTQDVGINVLPVNDIPFMSDAAATINSDEDFNVTVNLADYISDVDDALWFSCIYDENFTATINETTWDATFSPAENWNGQSTVTVYGADSEYMLARDLEFNIAAVNDAPTIVSSANQSFNEDESIEVDMNAFFADVDSELSFITYSADSSLKCQQGENNTLTISSSADNWNGQATIAMMATDGNYSVEQNILVNVNAVNDAPTVRSQDRTLTMYEDTTFGLEFVDMFQDIDGDTLTYEFSSSGNLELIYDSEGAIELRPTENWHGSILLNIMASDGKATAIKTLDINVESVNDLPVISATIEPVIAEPGDFVTIDLSAYFSDIDAFNLEFEVFGYENVIVTETEVPGIFQLAIPEDWEGTETIGVRASDGVDTVESEIFVSSAGPEIVTQTVTASASPMQSMFWLGIGILISVVGLATITTTRNRYGNKAPAGRDSIF